MSPETLPYSLAELADALRAKRLSPVEVVGSILEQIDALDGKLNAFITVLPERALEYARQAEREIGAGRYRGRLHGIPIGVKDIIYTKYARTTMGSAFFEDYTPDYNATVVSKLEEAGAIVIGKTNTHEFAYGATGDRSHFGPTKNPHNLRKIAGGSSSGSAAAVAAKLCYGALGSDTAGSVRIPSALCGTVGMKPAFGRVSKRGVFPLSWTLDHIGPLTRTTADSAILLSAISGFDRRDPYSENIPVEDFSRDIHRSVRGGCIGVPTNFYFEHLEDDVEERIREGIEVFRALGARVQEVKLPCVEEALKSQRVIFASEAYAIHKERLETEPGKFDNEVREYLLGGERLKAYRYVVAQQNKRRALKEFAQVLEEVEVLLTPTVPTWATDIDQKTVDIDGHEEAVHAALTRFVGPTNLIGLPSLSVPCPPVDGGMPTGLQLIGRQFDEATIYRYGHAYEEAVFSRTQT